MRARGPQATRACPRCECIDAVVKNAAYTKQRRPRETDLPWRVRVQRRPYSPDLGDPTSQRSSEWFRWCRASTRARCACIGGTVCQLARHQDVDRASPLLTHLALPPRHGSWFSVILHRSSLLNSTPSPHCAHNLHVRAGQWPSRTIAPTVQHAGVLAHTWAFFVAELLAYASS